MDLKDPIAIMNLFSLRTESALPSWRDRPSDVPREKAYWQSLSKPWSFSGWVQTWLFSRALWNSAESQEETVNVLNPF